MKKFAIVILSDDISVKHFEHKDEFEIALQSLETAGFDFIPLKLNQGTNKWTQPEVYR